MPALRIMLRTTQLLSQRKQGLLNGIQIFTSPSIGLHRRRHSLYTNDGFRLSISAKHLLPPGWALLILGARRRGRRRGDQLTQPLHDFQSIQLNRAHLFQLFLQGFSQLAQLFRQLLIGINLLQRRRHTVRQAGHPLLTIII